MAGDRLSLEIITPEGVTLTESEIDGIVVRRKEDRSLGSEMEVLPLHGPTLARVQACRLRYYRGGVTHYVDISDGFMEVKQDRVTIVTTGAISVADSAAGSAETA